MPLHLLTKRSQTPDYKRDQGLSGNISWHKKFIFQVCVTLGILGGNHYQRMGAWANNMSTNCMNSVMHRVVTAINAEFKGIGLVTIS